MEADVETTSLVKYVHIRCAGCTTFLRFTEEVAIGDLPLPE
jgi:hypothetical protein